MVDIEVVRALVAKVINAQEFLGKDELIAQVPHLSVDGGPVTFLALSVNCDSVGRSTAKVRKVSGRAWVFDGDRPLGGLEVWVDDGCLSALEYWWVTDTAPTELPDPARVRCEREGRPVS